MEGFGKLIGEILAKIPFLRSVLTLLAVLVFAFLVANNLPDEIQYSVAGRSTTGLVHGYRAGRGYSDRAEISYMMDDQEVSTTVLVPRFVAPNPGEQIAILVLSDRPHTPHLDSLWWRYGIEIASLALLGLFGFVAVRFLREDWLWLREKRKPSIR